MAQTLNVLIVNGHPRKNSLSEAFARAFYLGVSGQKIPCKLLNLYELSFNLNVIHHSPKKQLTEDVDIPKAQELISWANHIVFIYPTWWGTVPALLKGFIDRSFTEGFAFQEIEGGTGYAPLFKGKTAQLITTMDTPYLVYSVLYRAPGNNMLSKATLGFCGFHISKITAFNPVRGSNAATRDKWIGKVHALGAALKDGPLTIYQKTLIRIFAWLKAIRLQFYPMTFLAYWAGAQLAASMGFQFNRAIFWIGYLWLFLLEIATVLSNDFFDYQSDEKNKYFSPFSGGSRVLVEGDLSFSEVKKAIIACITAAVLLNILLFTIIPNSLSNLLPATLILTVLALGYSIPPLKLACRTLGEITVGFTHSFAVILCGFVFMGGSCTNVTLWILGLPLFFSILPSITLAGIPDYDADKQVEKETIAVRLGRKNAALIAVTFAWLAVIAVILLKNRLFDGLLYGAVPHVFLLSRLIYRYVNNAETPKRIDWILVCALTFIMWFVIVPLYHLT